MFRHCAATTVAALHTTKRQIWSKINCFLSAESSTTVSTGAQVGQKAFEFQQPDFKVAQRCLEVFRRFRHGFKTRERHTKELIVCLVRRRKVNEQIAHV